LDSNFDIGWDFSPSMYFFLKNVSSLFSNASRTLILCLSLFYSSFSIMKVYILISTLMIFHKNFSLIRGLIDYFATLHSFYKMFPYATKEELQDEDTCPICQEPFESAIRLPCNHFFHKWCLLRWLETQHSCPLCRENLSWKEASPLDENFSFILSTYRREGSNIYNFPENSVMGYITSNADIEQVREVFPQYTRQQIIRILQQTRSPEAAIAEINNRIINGQNI